MPNNTSHVATSLILCCFSTCAHSWAAAMVALESSRVVRLRFIVTIILSIHSIPMYSHYHCYLYCVLRVLTITIDIVAAALMTTEGTILLFLLRLLQHIFEASPGCTLQVRGSHY